MKLNPVAILIDEWVLTLLEFTDNRAVWRRVAGDGASRVFNFTFSRPVHVRVFEGAGVGARV